MDELRLMLVFVVTALCGIAGALFIIGHLLRVI